VNREVVIRIELAVCIVVLWLLLGDCTSIHAPVTLTFVDQEWTTTTFNQEREQEWQQFTRETGIQVKLLPSPESTREQLALWRELLRPGASGPDVYTNDVIWPGILNENFIDLKPYFATEISGDFPARTASYTVDMDNKLVAVPCDANIGLLYYRTDLLREYGYREPPRTWDELETMPARIQAGERATAKKAKKAKEEFWGGVWQVAPTGLVSRFSAHPREAVKVVRYLTSREVQVKPSRFLSEAPTRPELYDLPDVLKPNPGFALLSQTFRAGVVSRPSNITGKKYEDVSNAYMQAVHSVLTAERSAPEAATTLEGVRSHHRVQDGSAPRGTSTPSSRALKRNN
jgi:ABC-type glycerol-3-phosphate transport system substrate-binding protein